MRKNFFVFIPFLLMLCVFLLSCEEEKNTSNSNNDQQHEKVKTKNEGEDDNVSELDIYDFYFINKAPSATEKHSLEELIKIYFSAKNIAIDVKENEIYQEPLYSTNGIDTFEGSVKFNDKQGLIDIIEKYKVQNWKDDYTTEDPDNYEDGYGWLLLMQFEDGTVEKYRGAGPVKEEVIPKNFEAFGKELEEFVNKKMIN